MKSYLYIRSAIRMSVCLVSLLGAPFSFGAAADRPQVQAQLLDRAEVLCDNCFFGPSDYYYCFAADNKILIGYQSTPVLNWQDPSKNYLTAVHPSWMAWNSTGQTVPISYDDKHIWVRRAEGTQVRRGIRAQMKAMAAWASRGNSKMVKLTRSSKADFFNSNDQCRNAFGAKTH